MEEENNIDAQLHALHWAFFSSVMDKDFPELFAEFVTWCDNLSKEDMHIIMALDDEDDDDEDMDDEDMEDTEQPDQPEDSDDDTVTYTEDEIWKSLSEN